MMGRKIALPWQFVSSTHSWRRVTPAGAEVAVVVIDETAGDWVALVNGREVYRGQWLDVARATTDTELNKLGWTTKERQVVMTHHPMRSENGQDRRNTK